MSELNSQFSIAQNDLEIRFTYFYFLGYSLRIEGEIENDSCPFFVPRDGWKNGEEARYFSNNFIEKMELSHFHLDPKMLFGENSTFHVKTNKVIDEKSVNSYKFEFHDTPNSIESIGAIECSILKSGYLALTMRIINRSKIPSLEVLRLINNLELINKKVPITGFTPGNLITKMQGFVIEIESHLPSLLNRKNITRYNLDTDEHLPLPDLKYNTKRRSRPYIGVLFRFSDVDYNKLDHLRTSIQRFVIASARTTPEFLTSFSDPNRYLSDNNRNIYKPGKSIVYIARRAWCVFDAGDHGRHTFRVGVLETTHFVITSILAAARSWRKYIEDTETEAGKRFYKLNKETKNLINSKNNRNYQKALGDATRLMALTNLVSPSIGFSRLIESHTKSHTARTAVRRCEEISNIKELEKISQANISGYSSSLKIASNYYQVQASDYRKKGIIIAISALVINVIVSILVNVEKIKSWFIAS